MARRWRAVEPCCPIRYCQQTPRQSLRFSERDQVVFFACRVRAEFASAAHVDRAEHQRKCGPGCARLARRKTRRLRHQVGCGHGWRSYGCGLCGRFRREFGLVGVVAQTVAGPAHESPRRVRQVQRPRTVGLQYVALTNSAAAILPGANADCPARAKQFSSV